MGQIFFEVGLGKSICTISYLKAISFDECQLSKNFNYTSSFLTFISENNRKGQRFVNDNFGNKNY